MPQTASSEEGDESKSLHPSFLFFFGGGGGWKGKERMVRENLKVERCRCCCFYTVSKKVSIGELKSLQ